MAPVCVNRRTRPGFGGSGEFSNLQGAAKTFGHSHRIFLAVLYTFHGFDNVSAAMQINLFPY